MHITIIEDDKILSSNISKKLKKNGYNTKIINSYNEFIMNYFEKSDFFIIDISLKNGSGFDIIKNIREIKKLDSPIIIISGYSDIEKKIYGLDLGADDYLIKPFSSEELKARIRALTRRKFKISINSKIKYKNIIYNTSTKIVTLNNNEVNLTHRENNFIHFLLLNIGILITKEKIINSVWGEYDLMSVSDNNINVILCNIRKKLGNDFSLKTIINEGYILEK